MNSIDSVIRANRNGTPAVRGTRVTVYDVMDFHLAGDPPEQIAGAFGITVADARAAIEYIDSNRQKLVLRYQEILDRDRQGNPAHLEAMLTESHAKLVQLKAEIDRRRMATADVGEADDRIAG